METVLNLTFKNVNEPWFFGRTLTSSDSLDTIWQPGKNTNELQHKLIITKRKGLSEDYQQKYC